MASSNGQQKWTSKASVHQWSEGLGNFRDAGNSALKGFARLLGNSPGWMQDEGIMVLPRVASYACRFAAFSFGGTPPFKVDDDVYQADHKLNSMTAEERQELFQKSLEKGMGDERVQYRGRTVSLRKLFEKTKSERVFQKRGGGRDTTKEISENQERIAKMSVAEQNPNSEEMVLSPEVKDSLELTRISSGIFNKGFWTGNQFAYGLFARTENIKEVLGKKWANRDPKEVLGDSDFYHDIMCCSPAYELTLLVVPTKKLSLHQMQREYKARIAKTMHEIKASKEDMKELDHLVSLFDGNRLRGRVPWLSGTRILPRTMLFFSTDGDANLHVEVTNPGKLAEKCTVDLGKASNPKLTYAVFAELMGNRPICEDFRAQTASNMLYYANGFTCDSNPDNVMQMSLTGTETYTKKSEKIRPRMFQLDQAPQGKLLLKGKKVYQTVAVEDPPHDTNLDFVPSL